MRMANPSNISPKRVAKVLSSVDLRFFGVLFIGRLADSELLVDYAGDLVELLLVKRVWELPNGSFEGWGALVSIGNWNLWLF